MTDNFVKTEKGEPIVWPIAATEVYTLAPAGTIFPKDCSDVDLTAFGFAPLYYAEQPPTYDEKTQTLREGKPVLQKDRWVRTWEIVDLADDEIAARAAPRIMAFTPDEIIAALDGWGVGETVIEKTDRVTYTRFVRARRILETDERLLRALEIAGRSIDDLKQTISKLRG